MDNFRNLFEELYESVNGRSIAMASAEARTSKSVRMAESFDALPSGPQEEYLIQQQIRPVFGKEGVNDTPIGTHPDFIELEGTSTGTQKHYICTIFVDIKGSTRLSLLYPLETVYQFKNAVIKACIETIRSFDGYVHRIMGDAVMAFFGGKDTDKENAIADAINCIVVLRAILEESIKPWMERNGIDAKDFGFRIGCDFGNDDEVLWGGFGYKNVGEVSATGLPVDMASKLQSLAGKNQAMLGQGLLQYVNWPEKYSEIKKTTKDGSSENLPVVTPNITNSDGSPINYQMRQLAYRKSLEFSALPRSFRQQIDGSNVIDHAAISYKCFTVEDDVKSEYISASSFLEKHVSLVFVVTSNTRYRINYPLKVVFIKTNHGIDTPEDERDIEQKGKVRYLKKTKISAYNKAPVPFARTELEENTLYRGLHTMKCEIYDANEHLLFRDWIGVMIK
ncbi:conserved hypothetical protein [gamma proteobacterium HTCC5015]|nr:conserved hypothetical protein [gamma proteobacterium HTCC5015]